MTLPPYDGTCPRCGEAGTFVTNLEANALGPDQPHIELRVWECPACGFDWEIEKAPALYEWDAETGRVTRTRRPDE